MLSSPCETALYLDFSNADPAAERIFLDLFDEVVAEGLHETPGLFSAFIPTPSGLLEKRSGFTTEEEDLRALVLYGARTVRDWRYNNWGTGFDVHPRDIQSSDNIRRDKRGPGLYRIFFCTQICPPLAFLAELAAEWGVTSRVYYYIPTENCVGYAKDGLVLDEEEIPQDYSDYMDRLREAPWLEDELSLSTIYDDEGY